MILPDRLQETRVDARRPSSMFEAGATVEASAYDHLDNLGVVYRALSNP